MTGSHVDTRLAGGDVKGEAMRLRHDASRELER